VQKKGKSQDRPPLLPAPIGDDRLGFAVY